MSTIEGTVYLDLVARRDSKGKVTGVDVYDWYASKPKDPNGLVIKLNLVVPATTFEPKSVTIDLTGEALKTKDEIIASLNEIQEELGGK